MAVKMSTMVLGLLVAGFMILALSTFATNWAGEFSKSPSGDVMEIEANINQTLQQMYEKAKVDTATLQESKIYTGATDLGVVSAEPYKVLTSNLDTTKKLVLNTTTEMTKLLALPDWVPTLTISAFMLIMAALFVNAIFKRDV